MATHNRSGAMAYWALAVFLIGFGFLGILTIGLPFLLLGIMLAILSRRRNETGVIAAGVAAIFGFTLGYLLVVPLRCTTSVSSAHPTPDRDRRGWTSVPQRWCSRAHSPTSMSLPLPSPRSSWSTQRCSATALP